jgi:hypothetical protein
MMFYRKTEQGERKTVFTVEISSSINTTKNLFSKLGKGFYCVDAIEEKLINISLRS